mgnify:FL=1
MKTAYKPNAISSFKVTQKESFDVQDKKHPIREEIEKCIGTYNLTVVVEEDFQTQTVMKHVHGLISFICTLLKDGRVIAQGRGNSILNSSNKFLQRAVSSAFNSALAEAAIKATKVLDTFRNMGATPMTLEEAYKAKDEHEYVGITDKQKKYLLELVHSNISDEDERNKWESQINEFTKGEASEAIQSLKR